MQFQRFLRVVGTFWVKVLVLSGNYGYGVVVIEELKLQKETL